MAIPVQPIHIDLSGMLLTISKQLIISAGPILIQIGAMLVALAFLRDWLLKPLLLYVATEFQSEYSKRIYYDVFVEPYEEEKKKKSKADSKYEYWLDGTDMFDKHDDRYIPLHQQGIYIREDGTEYEKDWQEDYDFFEDFLEREEEKEEDKWKW